MKIKLHWQERDPHYRVQVAVGPDRDHMVVLGILAMRRDEAVALRQTIRQGVSGIYGAASGIFESGWPDELEGA